MRKRPQELTDAVSALYGTVTAKEVAAKFNIPLHTVYNIWRNLDRVKKPRLKADMWKEHLPEELHLNRKIYSSDVEEMRRLRKQGMKLQELAEYFSVSTFTICYHIHYHRNPKARTREQMRAYAKDYYHRKREYLLEKFSKEFK